MYKLKLAHSILLYNVFDTLMSLMKILCFSHRLVLVLIISYISFKATQHPNFYFSPKHQQSTLKRRVPSTKREILPKEKKERKKIDRADNWDPGSRLLPAFLTRYSAPRQKGVGRKGKKKKEKKKTDEEKYEVNLKRGSSGWAFSSRGLRVFVVDDRRRKKTREGGVVATRVGVAEESRGPINSWLRLDLANRC